RLAGADRYATAAAVSAASFGAGVPVAYVATGTNFPDALAAGPVAARAGGPILLTSPGSLSAATAAELRRVDPSGVIIVGSSGAVSDAVRFEIRALWN
ncbi:MAG TPA: cell wall-binding repeat-containing protein, partial [Candidatus Dormibacteraeota bacterium]|nr:cell wall-binding repeat-containing protein [Candidatus Dormibacteraeota bacterium]